MSTYRYEATINGTRRAVVFEADAEDWGHEGTPDEPAMLNLATADLIVANEYAVYRDFYAEATDADYDADHESPALWILPEGTWLRVE